MQMTAYSPASSGAVKVAVSPAGTSTSNPPSSLAVSVCGASSSLTTVTVAPGAMVPGITYSKPLMVTVASSAEVPVPAVAAADAGAAASLAALVAVLGPVSEPQAVVPAMTAATIRADMPQRIFIAILPRSGELASGGDDLQAGGVGGPLETTPALPGCTGPAREKSSEIPLRPCGTGACLLRLHEPPPQTQTDDD